MPADAREPVIYEGPLRDLCGKPAVQSLLWVWPGWEDWDGVSAFLNRDPAIYDYVFVATRFLRRPEGAR